MPSRNSSPQVSQANPSAHEISLQTKAIQRATCKVGRPGLVATAFLTKIQIPSSPDPLFGLITNNHILSPDAIVPNSTIRLDFETPPASASLTVNSTTFWFTDPLIDCTFVAIDPADQVGPLALSNFLSINESAQIDEPVLAVQLTEGHDLIVESGGIRCRWGFDYLREVNTEYGSSGSALCDRQGRAVALHSAMREEDHCHVATGMHYIAVALRNTFGSGRSAKSAKGLSNAELNELENNGLKSTANPDVFISPASLHVTPLWFYRTNHAWYWTPTQPDSLRMEDLKKSNWSVIWRDEPVRVIGGFWDGQGPASRNCQLIAWLISTGLRFLQ
jgi:hypothetical protein